MGGRGVNDPQIIISNKQKQHKLSSECRFSYQNPETVADGLSTGLEVPPNPVWVSHLPTIKLWRMFRKFAEHFLFPLFASGDRGNSTLLTTIWLHRMSFEVSHSSMFQIRKVKKKQKWEGIIVFCRTQNMAKERVFQYISFLLGRFLFVF